MADRRCPDPLDLDLEADTELGRRLPDIDFDALIQRADHQRATVEQHRSYAGTVAFAPRQPSTAA